MHTASNPLEGVPTGDTALVGRRANHPQRITWENKIQIIFLNICRDLKKTPLFTFNEDVLKSLVLHRDAEGVQTTTAEKHRLKNIETNVEQRQAKFLVDDLQHLGLATHVQRFAVHACIGHRLRQALDVSRGSWTKLN